MKLHLGCGNVHLDGWLNVAITEGSSVDRLDDVSTLETIVDESCDIIYASHVLEHFDREEYASVLSVWYNNLKPGAVMRLAVPDELLGIFYGGQRSPYDYHKMGFDEHSLSSKLKELGFTNIKTWDWKETEHAHLDDYSQSYLPHMDKNSGLLMSLNLEATK